LNDAVVAPLLATAPGRLRDWARAAFGPAGAFVAQELTGELWQRTAEGRCVVILLDDPASAIADMVELGAAPLDAANMLGGMLALASDSGRSPAPCLVSRTVGEDAASLCRRVRAALGLAEDMTVPPALPQPSRPSGRLAGELADFYLVPLQSYAAGATQALLHWPRAGFRLGEPPHETAPERVELVGPSRSLVYGPYLPLPAGWWEVEVRLYFSEEACRRTFSVDMVGEDNVGTIRLKPTSAGTFRARMIFHNPRADFPLALRVVLEHGAIEGRIGLESVLLRHSRSETTYERR
jgi:hypothetical protein